MPYNPLLGAGREPQVRNSISTTRIKQDSTGLASASNFPGTTTTASLEPAQRVFAIQINIFPTSTGSSIDSARFRVSVDQYVIADYKLPNTDAWLNEIQEIVPADVLTYPGSLLKVEFGPELADATGYNIGFSVTALAITV